MIKENKKKCISIMILIIIAVFLNMMELFLQKEGIEFRTFVQVFKGLYVWMIMPAVCIFLLYTIFIQRIEENRKGIRVLLKILLVALFIITILIDGVRGIVYIFSTECKDEKVLEDGILEVKESDWDTTKTSYDEIVCFFFRKPFEGYSLEELTARIQEKYGKNAEYIGMNKDLYQFSLVIEKPLEETIVFDVKNDYLLSNDCEQKLSYLLGNDFFETKNRSLQWIKSKQTVGEKYIPLISCFGREDLESFCNDITELAEFYLQNDILQKNTDYIDTIGVVMKQEETAFAIGKYLENYNRTELYNYLYQEMEKWMDSQYNNALAVEEDAIFSAEAVEEETNAVTEETIAYYLSLEPAAVFTTEAGMEYRVLETDRACGSSYYSLIATKDKGKTCALVNTDPFNGQGGGVNWITFIDENIGFVGMCYSGGSLGILFKTEDGGKSFSEIEYPSPKIKLPDGSYYNPFVMPMKVYEKEGSYIMEASQGPDGDYNGGTSVGVYQSDDLGKTWTFIDEK